ncbi:hypothetical protein PRIPAC_87292 [Pristionchus pacificus]|uniref:Uncharacterized protein n=1 Tax=Pristionchus pacificus TaxID=54126 RepID=A0A2A6CWP4_PRIPA|nr:hypothetical protein PRIPAC_87292 [Pristionchus pacificus]|eukprot:PDM82510.1 hypothetical protein PRIPAC_36903 [Pristionchus pacificus]
MKVLILLVLCLVLHVQGSRDNNEFSEVSPFFLHSHLFMYTMCIIFLTISTTGVPNEHLKRDRRALLDAQTKMWPKNETIYFGYADETASNFSTSNRADISGQLDEISKATCLKIEEKSAGFRGVPYAIAHQSIIR